MSDRVLSTREALDSVTQLRAIIGSGPGDGTIGSALAEFQRKCDVLADPNQWDGPKAIAFRNNYQGQIVPSLRSLISELNEMRDAIQSITDEIRRAGGF